MPLPGMTFHRTMTGRRKNGGSWCKSRGYTWGDESRHKRRIKISWPRLTPSGIESQKRVTLWCETALVRTTIGSHATLTMEVIGCSVSQGFPRTFLIGRKIKFVIAISLGSVCLREKQSIKNVRKRVMRMHRRIRRIKQNMQKDRMKKWNQSRL